MGNCQAAEAAAVVIQHPGGKVERLYGPATAGEVMRSNPGHYVALVVLRVAGVGGAKPDPLSAGAAAAAGGGVGGGVTKITKVKLLKPKDALLLGQVYRLITSQEVAKAIQARRQDKTRRCEEALDDRRRRQPSQPGHAATAAGGDARGQPGADEVRKRAEKADRHHRGGSGGGGAAARGGRNWRPSLQSISESAS
ncbi:hypothetical protein SEVIR_6G155300v4 [Setaria viridis]|uniref:Uncharacterized protein n=1 Tax=Setaria viridis TaxID=4556 RepID=A0A4U6U914_SETVI|nr:uncharacterized protein LOC117861263 [Setaria viridis]TKW10313.1 hypothetical protein SEVIR_6G155300v2 [Setaria viridis]